MARFVSRLERHGAVDSTQRIVRERLLRGEPEVCVAVADAQTAGRGRLGRSWQAPAGSALLVSAGFRPHRLAAGRAWQLGAVAGMAMLEAVRQVAGQPAARDHQLYLKWPNDLVALRDGRLLKLAGVLGESTLEGAWVTEAVVGVGLNIDWGTVPYPPELAGTIATLADLGVDGIGRDMLLDAWLVRLEAHYSGLRAGRFDAPTWQAMQVTTGARVEIDRGADRVSGVAVGVDAQDGSLLLREHADAAILAVSHGDVVRCRVREVGTPL